MLCSVLFNPNVLGFFFFFTQGVSENQVAPKKISLSVVSSILDVPSQDWDACNMDATGPEKFNPFLTHGFLSSLEETGCAVKVG